MCGEPQYMFFLIGTAMDIIYNLPLPAHKSIVF